MAVDSKKTLVLHLMERSEWASRYLADGEEEIVLGDALDEKSGRTASVFHATSSTGKGFVVKMQRSSNSDSALLKRMQKIFRNEYWTLNQIARKGCSPEPIGYGEVVERVVRRDSRGNRREFEFKHVAIAESLAAGKRLTDVIDGSDRFDHGYRAGAALSARTCAEISDVIDRMHGARIAHRDIKPGNIMVSFPGGVPRTLLVDFGISAENGAERTRSAVVMGSPPFAPPEKIDRDADFAGALDDDGLRADKSIFVDVYSVGQIALCMRLVGEKCTSVSDFCSNANGGCDFAKPDGRKEYIATRRSYTDLAHYVPVSEFVPGDRALKTIIDAASRHYPFDRPRPAALAEAFGALASWCDLPEDRAVDEGVLVSYLRSVLAGDVVARPALEKPRPAREKAVAPARPAAACEIAPAGPAAASEEPAVPGAASADPAPASPSQSRSAMKRVLGRYVPTKSLSTSSPSADGQTAPAPASQASDAPAPQATRVPASQKSQMPKVQASRQTASETSRVPAPSPAHAAPTSPSESGGEPVNDRDFLRWRVPGVAVSDLNSRRVREAPKSPSITLQEIGSLPASRTLMSGIVSNLWQIKHGGRMAICLDAAHRPGVEVEDVWSVVVPERQELPRHMAELMEDHPFLSFIQDELHAADVSMTIRAARRNTKRAEHAGKEVIALCPPLPRSTHIMLDKMNDDAAGPGERILVIETADALLRRDLAVLSSQVKPVLLSSAPADLDEVRLRSLKRVTYDVLSKRFTLQVADTGDRSRQRAVDDLLYEAAAQGTSSEAERRQGYLTPETTVYAWTDDEQAFDDMMCFFKSDVLSAADAKRRIDALGGTKAVLRSLARAALGM